MSYAYGIKRKSYCAWACHDTNTTAWQTIYIWKKHPTENYKLLEMYAKDLVALIRWWCPVIPKNWVVTVPPAGASQRRDIYPAGCLGKAVACLLDLDFIDLLRRTDEKKAHHPHEALRQSPFVVNIAINSVVLVVDDIMTSGRTMELSLRALWDANIPAFGFVWVRRT